MKRQKGLALGDFIENDAVAKEIGEAALNLSGPRERGSMIRGVAAWEAKENAKLYARKGWRPKEC